MKDDDLTNLEKRIFKLCRAETDTHIKLSSFCGAEQHQYVAFIGTKPHIIEQVIEMDELDKGNTSAAAEIRQKMDG